MGNSKNTVAAISTPRGTGGIAVIRISGDEAFDIGEKIFKCKNRKFKNFKDIPANISVFGEITEPAETKVIKVIDEGMAVKFKAPQSYTGEDTVEISCHGGIYLTNAVLKSAIEAGARIANPGEFTKRAYINGKISLTGAEAVGRLISASNETGARVARAQSKGGLSKKIGEISGKIKQIISEVYVYIDYPGEDLTDLTPEIMLENMTDILCELENLKKSYEAGSIISDGIDCAIIGKPNTGKSTLLNLLSGDEIAIVHDSPGTTRDIVTSKVNVGEFVLNLHDTAGIRKTSAKGDSDIIENIGIEKAKTKAEKCGLIIGVFDISGEFDEEDYNIIQILNYTKTGGKKIIIVLNKCDEYDIINIDELDKLGRIEKIKKDFDNFDGLIIISAKNNTVLNSEIAAYDMIKNCVEDIYNLSGYDLDSGEMLTEERQYFEICEAVGNINSAMTALKSGFTQDVAGLDLELALQSLDRCDSKSVSEDIVDLIFKNFCVGK